MSCNCTAASPTAEALKDVEREHILQILRKTAGVIGGRRGAAVRLGFKRTTLLSKMEKLGIPHDRKNITVALHDIPKSAPPVKA